MESVLSRPFSEMSDQELVSRGRLAAIDLMGVVLELRARGWTIRKIAREIGLPSSTVGRWLGPVPNGTLRLNNLEELAVSGVCEVRECSMQELLVSGVEPDVLVTDPPYPREYLPLYGELARLSSKVPTVAVMCGQSYLPEILAEMSKHLKYRWTMAYLTPGGEVTQWQARVKAQWKPILVFGDAPEEGWLTDLVTSDNVDKRFHEWGQSEGGMGVLIDRLTKPGDLVCDPFLGAGTTGVAALRLGRRFLGCDTDPEAVKVASDRCARVLNMEAPNEQRGADGMAVSGLIGSASDVGS